HVPRLHRQVLVVLDDRLVKAVVLGEQLRELEPQLRVGRVLGNLLLHALDGRTAAASEEVDVAVQEVGEGATAGTDAEEHEATCEHDGEEGEDPPRVPAQAPEEELRLVVGTARNRLGAGYLLRLAGIPSSLSLASTPFCRSSGRVSRARARKTAARSSSKMSNDGAEAGLSVPRPTVIPASRSFRSGAIPQPSTAFERGQWIAATPCSASSAISRSSTQTQC